MNDLIAHMVKPLLTKPDLLEISITNDEDALIRVDVLVAEEDFDAVSGDDGRTERALRHLLSIASGAKKPFLTLKSLNSDEENSESSESSESSEASE